MKKDLILSLFAYGQWANEKILAQVAHLGDEQFKKQWSTGYRSIHENLIHLISADHNWLRGWQGLERAPRLTAEDLPDLASIRTLWSALWEERRAYLESLSEAELEASISPPDRPALLRWQAMLQAANHATQHRAEMAAMLTDAGQSPGDIDYVFFVLNPA